MKENNQSSKLVNRSILLPFILITSCFAWWGLANNMTDTLLAAFKRIKSMSDFQTSLIQMAFYGAYFCFALPAAIYIKKYSYKSGVLLGLALFITGGLLFYPASYTQEYWHFLAALYILAGGLSILETSANPYIIALGPAKTGTQRLNLAQSFNPLGSISGVLISKFFILSNLQQISAEDRSNLSSDALIAVQSEELNAVMGPYVVVSLVLVVIWLMILKTKMPLATDAIEKSTLKESVKRLLKNKNYVTSVVAQFFYVGAQICVWSYTIRYIMGALELNEEQASSYYLASLILFSISRFVCTGLMSIFKPGQILTVLSLLAILCTALVMTSQGMVGVIALVCISGCMSLMFPTIYGLGLYNLGKDTKIGGSGLIMAILGGAVLTAIQGQISDLSGSIRMSFIVPLVCFVVVLLFGMKWFKKSPQGIKTKGNESPVPSPA